MRLLQIDSSARAASVTRKLTARFANEWKKGNPGGVADTIVIGAPMYNHSIPALLKAWIDQIVRFGKTFGYGPNGPRGLLETKKVFVITARGGAYEKGTPTEAFDFQTPYLHHILGFIGLTDITFIHAENQLREQAAAPFETAIERISASASDQKMQPVTN